MTVSVQPRKVFRVRIWSALKYFTSFCALYKFLLNLLCWVCWISAFQKSAEARIRTTWFANKWRGRGLWRNWQWEVCLSRIVYPEVHWSLDREIIRILLHLYWTIAKMLLLSPTRYMQTKLHSIRMGMTQGYQLDHSLKLRLLKTFFDNVIRGLLHA